MNHSVDRRKLRLIPSPVGYGRQEGHQEDQARCDETCDDRMTFEKCGLNQTRKLIMKLEPKSHALVKSLAQLSRVQKKKKQKHVRMWSVR